MQTLFFTRKFAWVWLIVRLWLSWQWIDAAVAKFQGDMWVGAHAGVGLTGFVTHALTKTTGAHPDVQGWYAVFLKDFVLPHAVQFSYMVAFGELLVGLALLAGAFTGFAAFFGAFMNMSYLAAGTVSINPYMLVLEICVLIAWRVAGYIGLDMYLLFLIGGPGQKGELFKEEAKKKWNIFGREMREK